MAMPKKLLGVANYPKLEFVPHGSSGKLYVMVTDTVLDKVLIPVLEHDGTLADVYALQGYGVVYGYAILFKGSTKLVRTCDRTLVGWRTNKEPEVKPDHPARLTKIERRPNVGLALSETDDMVLVTRLSPRKYIIRD